VISAYQDLAKQISVALMHEERRCGYFTRQKLRMWALQDDISTSPEGTTTTTTTTVVAAAAASVRTARI